MYSQLIRPDISSFFFSRVARGDRPRALSLYLCVLLRASGHVPDLGGALSTGLQHRTIHSHEWREQSSHQVRNWNEYTAMGITCLSEPQTRTRTRTWVVALGCVSWRKNVFSTSKLYMYYSQVTTPPTPSSDGVSKRPLRFGAYGTVNRTSNLH